MPGSRLAPLNASKDMHRKNRRHTSRVSKHARMVPLGILSKLIDIALTFQRHLVTVILIGRIMRVNTTLVHVGNTEVTLARGLLARSSVSNAGERQDILDKPFAQPREFVPG